MIGSARIIRGNALNLPIADNTVDAVITSPPYFGLRAYQDNGETYEGQIGAEPTPAEFVDALISATREMVRVLKPSGSIFVNLGDKYSGGNNTRRGTHDGDASTPTMARNGRILGFPQKSLIGIPWRYALRCIDDLGLILRAEIIWAKNNGLPESVTDRVRRAHEQWFMFQPSSGEVVESDAQRFPFCPICGLPKDARSTLISRLHELESRVENLDLPDHVWPDERIQGQGGVGTQQPGVVGFDGAGVPFAVPVNGDGVEYPADFFHNGRSAVVDDDTKVRSPVATVAEGHASLSVDDASEPRQVCSCSHPFIVDDEPWIPQSLAAELMQMVANGEADAQHVADFLSGDFARTHSTWFHFTKSPRYYSAVDEIREEHGPATAGRNPHGARGIAYKIGADGINTNGIGSHPTGVDGHLGFNPLGKLPGSVWTVPTQPLQVPAELGVDHFAAYPCEWPRRIISGWCPREVCTVCGEGRRPVAGHTAEWAEFRKSHGMGDYSDSSASRAQGNRDTYSHGLSGARIAAFGPKVAIHGYACACPDTTAPSTPGLVLDPFMGTGTTLLVAKVLGRNAVGVDLSADYCRLATWRTTDPGEMARAAQVEKPDPIHPDQLDLFGEAIA